MQLLLPVLGALLLGGATPALAGGATQGGTLSRGPGVDPGPGGARRSAEACLRAHPQETPKWAVSGAWLADGSSLFLVDSSQNRVMRFSPDGQTLEDPPGLSSAALPHFVPSYLVTADDGLLLGYPTGRMLQVDRRLAVTDEIDVFSTKPKDLGLFQQVRAASTRGAAGARRGLRSLYMWDRADDGSLIGYGDVETVGGGGDHSWAPAFVRIPPAEPSRFQILKSYDSEKPTLLFARITNHYVTHLGDDAYILAMETTPRIYRARRGSTKLEEVLDLSSYGFDTPELPAFDTFADYASVMATIERTEMPVGLFGMEGDLYLLWRRPRPGGTQWLLSRIDPKEPVLDRAATAVLPTRANHLTVVPGPSEWAFVEKGPVYSIGDQDVTGLLFLSDDAIASLKLPRACSP